MADFDPKRLEAEGWKRQNVIDEPRLSELVELYRSLGYEVLLVPSTRLEEPSACEDPSACDACFGDRERYKIIYTRKK